MNKYRIRKGSIADYGRFVLVGLAFGPGLAALYMFF